MDMFAVFYDDGRHPGGHCKEIAEIVCIAEGGRGGIPKIYEELSHVKALSALHHDVFI